MTKIEAGTVIVRMTVITITTEAEAIVMAKTDGKREVLYQSISPLTRHLSAPSLVPSGSKASVLEATSVHSDMTKSDLWGRLVYFTELYLEFRGGTDHGVYIM